MMKIVAAALVAITTVAPAAALAQPARPRVPPRAQVAAPPLSRTDAGAARRPGIITSSTPNASGNLGGPSAGGGGGGGGP